MKMSNTRTKRTIIWLSCLLGMAFFSVQFVSAQIVQPDELGFIIGQPEDLTPPEGARSVTILGNPSEPGPYVIRITFPPGAGSRPHFHSTARYITVIKGTWYTSWGPESDVYDPDNMLAIKEGTFVFQPPGGHHYDMAKEEEVIVQIMGMGPVVTTSIPQ
jgi:quercetin dioxygenase-like cupin family protein|tara:strand:+ start:1568 stop:2047 length:480 start_codon:yes stop_codon:yes gene_type:complete